VDTKLLVIGPYELGFTLTPQGNRSLLRVFIKYDLPGGQPARWLGRLFAGIYARWCTGQMVRDAMQRLGRLPSPAERGKT